MPAVFQGVKYNQRKSNLSLRLQSQKCRPMDQKEEFKEKMKQQINLNVDVVKSNLYSIIDRRCFALSPRSLYMSLCYYLACFHDIHV